MLKSDLCGGASSWNDGITSVDSWSVIDVSSTLLVNEVVFFRFREKSTVLLFILISYDAFFFVAGCIGCTIVDWLNSFSVFPVWTKDVGDVLLKPSYGSDWKSLNLIYKKSCFIFCYKTGIDYYFEF